MLEPLPVPEKGLQESWRGFLPGAWSNKTRGNGFQLKKGRSRLDVGRKSFTFGVVGTGCSEKL